VAPGLAAAVRQRATRDPVGASHAFHRSAGGRLRAAPRATPAAPSGRPGRVFASAGRAPAGRVGVFVQAAEHRGPPGSRRVLWESIMAVWQETPVPDSSDVAAQGSPFIA
jgi:hypothetical protein